MSIFIILVLIFVYGYCSALEVATDPMEPTGGFNGNYYDSNHRLLSRFRDGCNSCGSRNWDLEKFKK